MPTNLTPLSPTSLFREVSKHLRRWKSEKPDPHTGLAKLGNCPKNWEEKKSIDYRAISNNQQFLLRLELREHEISGEKIVSILGRRLDPKSAIKGTNTQALSFDSRKTADGLFFIEPSFLRNRQSQQLLRAMLPERLGTPYCKNQRVFIGASSVARFVRDLLSALAAIERLKAGEFDSHPSKYDLDTYVSDEDLSRTFVEGAVYSFTGTRRTRSSELWKLAIWHGKTESVDGRLRCCVCNWAPLIETAGDIVQIHHEKPLHTLPKSGKKFSFEEALDQLFPLCPNCHQTLHSKPGGGCYRVQELKELIPPVSRREYD